MSAIDQTILEAREVRKTFGGHVVLDGLDLRLNRGNVVLLRGANGSGKTTLLNILAGCLEPDVGSIVIRTNGSREKFLFPRSRWNSLNPLSHFSPERLAQNGVGRTWQEMRLFPTLTIRDNISVSAQKKFGENPLYAMFRPFSVREEERRIERQTDGSLNELGLLNERDTVAEKVSLGQAKRAAILRAVRAGAKILFLDEPLAGLDHDGRLAVIQLLKKLAVTGGLTLVIVEHPINIPHILDFVQTVWTVINGKIQTESPAKVREELAHRPTEWLELIAMDSGVARTKIIRQELVGGATVSKVQLDRSVLSQSRESERNQDRLLEVRNLVVKRGQRMVIGKGEHGKLSGLSLSIDTGELLQLRAPNGWGKTTLLETIVGMCKPIGGTISMTGSDIIKHATWERSRLGLSLLQARNHTFSSLSVREALRFVGADENSRNLAHIINKRSCDLSGGEKQLVAMMCAVANKSLKVLLMDEPFSALDSTGLDTARSIIKDLLPRCGVLVAEPGYNM
jgi:ABC-type branched-subunit amino acid transport system ATPase component